MLSVTGSVAVPVSTETVISSVTPTLMLASAKAAAPPTGTSMMPLFVGVATSAMMSAMGVLEKTRSTVSTPVMMLAALSTPALRQSKSSGMAGALNGAVPWNETTKLWMPSLPAIVTGVLAVPVSALVAGLVV